MSPRGQRYEAVAHNLLAMTYPLDGPRQRGHNMFRQVWLKLRIAWRAHTFEQGRKMGMTKEEALIYVNDVLPLNSVEAAFEGETRQKNKVPPT